MPQLGQLVTGFPLQWPGSDHAGLVVDKVALGQVFCILVSPANLHSTNCSTITIIWGWYSRPIVATVPSGLSLTPIIIIIIINNSPI
jgi:hypothetical protein